MVGFDIGTGFLVAARQEGDKVTYVKQRNAFLELPADEKFKGMLDKAKVPYIVLGGKIYAVGEEAFQFANIFNKEMRRPMAKGIISKTEKKDAIPILKILFESILGKPKEPNELCVYSIPANPVDQDDNNMFHSNVMGDILKAIGYDPRPELEGHALAFGELGGDEDNFTGIGWSCGAGSQNLGFIFMGLPVFAFSYSRSGDYIDLKSAEAVGESNVKVMGFKESPDFDLATNYLTEETEEGRIKMAIQIVYKSLVHQVVEYIARAFDCLEDKPNITKPLSIVVAGGTSKPKGFLNLVQAELQSNPLPFPVKGVRTSSEEPLFAVAKGLLTLAMAK